MSALTESTNAAAQLSPQGKADDVADPEQMMARHAAAVAMAAAPTAVVATVDLSSDLTDDTTRPLNEFTCAMCK
jgi:hypothetical protein